MSQIIRPQSSSQEGPILPARPCLPPRPKPMEPMMSEQQISPPSQQPISMQQPLQPTPTIDTYQSAIYEEIKDDIVSKKY